MLRVEVEMRAKMFFFVWGTVKDMFYSYSRKTFILYIPFNSVLSNSCPVGPVLRLVRVKP